MGVYSGQHTTELIFMSMLNAVLFMRPKKWRQPKCLLTDKWIKKMWHTCTTQLWRKAKSWRFRRMGRNGNHCVILNKSDPGRQVRSFLLLYVYVVCMHVCISSCVWTCVSVWECVCMCMSMCVCTWMCVYVYERVYVCMCCVCVCYMGFACANSSDSGPPPCRNAVVPSTRPKWNH